MDQLEGKAGRSRRDFLREGAYALCVGTLGWSGCGRRVDLADDNGKPVERVMSDEEIKDTVRTRYGNFAKAGGSDDEC